MTRKLLGFALLLVGGVLGTACVTTERVYVQPTQRPAPQETVRYAGPEDEPFYDDLAPYGEWVQVQGPGWVWYPYSVPAGWRPYSYGRWVYTDYGWTWASDESFGWATYHYGRWNADPDYGWVWVPGTEWGPAWVAWHEGGGYVGWAPLPWQVTWRAGIGLDWGSVNINVALGPSSWYFVRDRDMVAPNLRGCILPVARNVTLIHNTVHVTNYVYVDNRIVDRSVHKEKIGRAVGHTIPSYRVRRSDSPEEGRGGRVKGQEFVVFRGDPGRGHNPQRREVPPGHDGQQPRDDDQDRPPQRGPNRRTLPPGHDAYPPQDDQERDDRSPGRQNRDSQTPDEQGSRDLPRDRDTKGRTVPPGQDPSRNQGGESQGSGEARPPQRKAGPDSEPGKQPPRNGQRPPRYANPPEGDTGAGQQPRRSPGTESTPGGSPAPSDSGSSRPTQDRPQGGERGNDAGQKGNGGSVSPPPSAPPGQSKPGSSANSAKPAAGKKPAGKGKGKKPAPPDPKPDTGKPEEEDAKQDGSGS